MPLPWNEYTLVKKLSPRANDYYCSALLVQVTPFLRGQVQVITDTLPVMREEEMAAKVAELRKVLADVQQLQIKLKVPSRQITTSPLHRITKSPNHESRNHQITTS